MRTAVLRKWLLVGTAVLVAPIVEETIFRGFIYGVMKRYTDRWFAMLLSSDSLCRGACASW